MSKRLFAAFGGKWADEGTLLCVHAQMVVEVVELPEDSFAGPEVALHNLLLPIRLGVSKLEEAEVAGAWLVANCRLLANKQIG